MDMNYKKCSYKYLASNKFLIQSIFANHSISESYISYKFSKYMGVSYVKYLTQLRINKAIELLNENLDIKDIYTTLIKAICIKP